MGGVVTLEKFKKGANKLRIPKDSTSQSPAPLNVHHEHIPSTSAAPSGAEMEADTQPALQGTEEVVEHMHSLSGLVTTMVSHLGDTQEDLDKFQDTYLKPLKIFDTVIGEINNVHPYAKIAQGALSCVAKFILARSNYDAAVLKLLDKFIAS
ncbi:hypothetical protein BD769DRAFT_1671077 [Suillus cothurnatus]|nr:hypothetical protein BD769DRAFT_1680374 [Suillus cothurnatus]KAG2121993.1 hypothetical protein BD769DRAFT_1671069 [Suillus cothurnatus]KAG2122004.1 hypothetical protein BD769DRAFT_1671077 [Suillus cothurnatus]